MEHPVFKRFERFGLPLSSGDRSFVETLIASQRWVPARSDFMREGDDPSDLYVVTQGLACRYKLLENGKRQILAFLIPGDFVNPYVLISGAMHHNIATIVATRFAEVPRSSLRAAVDRPAIAELLLFNFASETARAYTGIATIGQRRSQQRLAHFLCELYSRMEDVGLVDCDGIDFPIAQHDIGDAVGLSLVHVNKSLSLLRSNGFIRLAKRRLEILDRKGLEAFCNFTPDYLHPTKSASRRDPHLPQRLVKSVFAEIDPMLAR